MKQPARIEAIGTVSPSGKIFAIHVGILALLFLLLACQTSLAQSTSQETPQQEVQRLSLAVEEAQAQMEASRQQLLELKQSLTALQQRLSKDGEGSSSSAQQTAAIPVNPTPSRIDDISERQAMQASQIATLSQEKVGTESRYPVKLSGLILLNGFVNTSQVDLAATPTTAAPGGGSTGASIRQTILGVDARGPSIAGAISHADLRVDFFGGTTQTSYSDIGGLVRFRTGHAILDWPHTQAFVEMDRPIISPNTPTSLVAVAIPPLAWSGNLWTWSPQIGVSHTFDLGDSAHLAITGALIDVPDPPAAQGVATGVSLGEQSRWPGSEIHLGLMGKAAGPAIGIGGYFSPHKTTLGTNFDAWAGTMDMRLPLPTGFELSGSFYRGLALGGLGGGTYKDYVYAAQTALPLDDVGGWAQLKKRAGSRLEFNGAFGMDNTFASEFREYADTSAGYHNLARNQTFSANAIYSPSAYLLFSLEYRHFATTPVTGPAANSNVIGIAAGYKF